MATGDQSDMFSRLKALMPLGWFGDSSPVLDALLYGIAQALAWVYSLYQFVALQSRIATSTGGYLDIVANDFFGSSLVRSSNQSDDSFRNRIQMNLFRERCTRNAVYDVLYDLTGVAPTIIELKRPADTGAYGYAAGYGTAGHYGSVVMPYQSFVIAYRGTIGGYPYISGYGTYTGGYSQSSRADYATLSGQSISDADIYAAVESVKPAGTIAWVRIS